MRKKLTGEAPKPYGHNPKIFVYTELPYKKIIIRPGMEIKIKNQRGTFIFYKWVHNSELDVTWIDCMDKKTGHWRGFYMDQLKGVVTPKKSIAKKI